MRTTTRSNCWSTCGRSLFTSWSGGRATASPSSITRTLPARAGIYGFCRSRPQASPREGAKPRPYLVTNFNELNARFSPEPSPRWVAYQSDETGRYEVYVQGFPEPHAKFPISTGGGQYPEWDTSGSKLFFVAPDNKLMVADLRITADTVQPSAPRALFTLPIIDKGYNPYETIDGQRFLVRAVPQQAPPLTVIVNWPALLKKGSAAQ